MIKSELYKFFKSWKSIIVVLIALSLGVLHTIDSIFYTGISSIKLNPYHPAFASFLNGTSARGNYRTYFLWIMPVLFIIAYCGKTVDEKKNNIDLICYTKKNVQQYFFSKIITSGIVASFINLVPNIVSIILTTGFLHGKTGFMDSETFSVADEGIFNYWCIHHPYSAYMIFLVCNLIVTALLGMMCQSVVFLVEDAKLSMLIVMAIWMGLYYGNKYFFIGSIMQPFVDENTLSIFLMCWVTYVPMIIFWVGIAWDKVVKKRDKI